jgi:hypothetical protein
MMDDRCWIAFLTVVIMVCELLVVGRLETARQDSEECVAVASGMCVAANRNWRLDKLD